MFQVNNQQIFAKSHRPEKETQKKEAKPTIKSLKCDKILLFLFLFHYHQIHFAPKAKIGLYLLCNHDFLLTKMIFLIFRGTS